MFVKKKKKIMVNERNVDSFYFCACCVYYDCRNMHENLRGFENFLQLHISSIMFKYILNAVTVVFFIKKKIYVDK